jgi:hypothetical protein
LSLFTILNSLCDSILLFRACFLGFFGMFNGFDISLLLFDLFVKRFLFGLVGCRLAFCL